MAVGARIRDHRRALGLSQEELAERLGMSQASISRLENDELLTLETLERVCAELGLEVQVSPVQAAEAGGGR